MFDGRFDGLDVVALAVADAAPLVDLYHSMLGFEVVAEESPAPEGLAELLGFPAPASRVVHLSRGMGVGGDVVLVETTVAPRPAPAASAPLKAGVFALDFYLRDAPASEAVLDDGGWEFISEAVHYDLPGTTIPVRERMLVQPHSGVLHALVQDRPGGTRSVLGTDGNAWCSEVVAVVVLTPDISGARSFAEEVLGGREYFRGTFAGPAVERMLRFGPGEGLDASLYRGPASRNARLEFARPVDREGQPLPMVAEAGRVVVPGLLADDLDTLLDRLADGTHGEIGAVGEVDWLGARRPAARFDSAYDVSFLLLGGGTTAS